MLHIKKIYSLLIIVSFYQCAQTSDIVRIFTTAYNRPDFIEIQKKTFDKFLKDPYEYYVFSDAPHVIKLPY